MLKVFLYSKRYETAVIRVCGAGSAGPYRCVRVYGDPLVRDGRKIYEHQYVMMKMLRRKLRKGEQVHHKNHASKRDNRPDNLELQSSGEHTRLHLKHYYATATPEQRAQRSANISKAKKGKPQPWARAVGLSLKGIKRSAEFKRRVSAGMQKYCATLPAGEMARRGKREMT